MKDYCARDSCSAAEERTASLIGRLLSADPQAPTRITKNFDNF
jgi:hypothetical protein